MSTSRYLTIVCLSISTTALAACGDGSHVVVEAANRPRASFDTYVRSVGSVSLQESDAVINVAPNVTIDSAGLFLIADQKEHQIRSYDGTGELLAHFGREGGGPGEFESLIEAHRLGTGDIVALEMFGRATIFGPRGDAVLQTLQLPVTPIYSAAILNDSVAVIAGRRSDPATALHLVDLTSGELIRSFLQPPEQANLAGEAAAALAGFVDVALRGDTIAGLLAHSDSVYLFNLEGSLLERIPIPYEHFRAASAGPAPPPPGSPIQTVRDWVGSFSFATDLYWMNDGSFLIQYQDRVDMEPRWRMLSMTRAGVPHFEIVDSPRLLTANSRHLYFVAPTSETPAEWFVGEVKRRD